MLLTNQLDYILGQASKVRILRFLITADAELNGREIANAVGLSHVKVHTALKEFSRHGVVVMRRAGKSIAYRLNKKNVLVKKMLIPLFEKEAQLKEMLIDVVSKYLKKPHPKSIILFGSFASGRAQPDSDIDILIVTSNEKDIHLIDKALEEAENETTLTFGNRLAPLFMDMMTFRKKFKSNDDLVRTIAKEGKVLMGASINELIQSND